MHSDKKYLMMTNGDGELDIVKPYNGLSPGLQSDSVGSPTGSEIGKPPSTGWINTVPLSASSNTIGKRSNRSKRVISANVIVKDYIKKRNLILELLAVEIEMLLVRVTFTQILYLNEYCYIFHIIVLFLLTQKKKQVWRNPGGRQDMTLPGESSIAEWRAKTMNDRWRDCTRLAWDISPALAVFLPVRLKNSDTIIQEVRRLIRLHPVSVMHIPEALQYLVTTDTLLTDSPEVLFTFSYKLVFKKLMSALKY